VTGHHQDGPVDALLGHPLKNGDAIHSGHPHVEHHAAWWKTAKSVDECAARREFRNIDVGKLEQSREGRPYGVVILYKVDRCRHHEAPFLVGVEHSPRLPHRKCRIIDAGALSLIL
jgi:hypothetical protein